MEFYDEEWVRDWFAPLDFLGVLRYPRKLHGFDPCKDDKKKCIPIFHVDKDLFDQHVV